MIPVSPHETKYVHPSQQRHIVGAPNSSYISYITQIRIYKISFPLKIDSHLFPPHSIAHLLGLLQGDDPSLDHLAKVVPKIPWHSKAPSNVSSAQQLH